MVPWKTRGYFLFLQTFHQDKRQSIKITWDHLGKKCACIKKSNLQVVFFFLPLLCLLKKISLKWPKDLHSRARQLFQVTAFKIKNNSNGGKRALGRNPTMWNLMVKLCAPYGFQVGLIGVIHLVSTQFLGIFDPPSPWYAKWHHCYYKLAFTTYPLS